jgi:hypothetical protein
MHAASLAAKSVNAGPNSNAIKPRFDIFVLGFSIAPQFQKNFHGKFFGAAAVANNTFDDAGHSRIVSVKERFDIEWRGAVLTSATASLGAFTICITPLEGIS